MNQNIKKNPEFDNDEIVIDITEFFKAVWHKLPVAILVGIAAALVAFAATKLFVTPMYTSETKLYVLSKQDGNSNLTYNDLQIGTSLTKDYMELVKSRPVLDQVIKDLNLNMKTDELARDITVDTPVDTRILRISVKNKDPRTAKEIADKVREWVSVQITKIMDADSVNTVEVANLPAKPSSPNVAKNMIIGAALGLLLAIGAIVLLRASDDTLKTPEDVEHYLDLNVLTSIPIQGGMNKARKRRGLSASRHSTGK